jgi:hypothetical protein
VDAAGVHPAKEASMKMKSIQFFNVVLVIAMFWVIPVSSSAVEVIREDGKTYLVDQTGEHWDISQAVSIGYDPHQFEFGIGRHAFQVLDDRHWHNTSAPSSVSNRMRVIGVADNGDAHAYSVAKLRYHEIANTYLGDEAIVVGY